MVNSGVSVMQTQVLLLFCVTDRQVLCWLANANATIELWCSLFLSFPFLSFHRLGLFVLFRLLHFVPCAAVGELADQLQPYRHHGAASQGRDRGTSAGERQGYRGDQLDRDADR